MSLKIYTKTGDDGTTGLFGGGRVAKDSLRIESYGAVDELNSAIGLARSHPLDRGHDELLGTVQEQLFILGADLATPRSNEAKNLRAMRVTSEEIVCLERAIDDLESGLPPLKSFILPGGSPSGAALHLARTICRRAERRVAALMHQEADIGELPLKYLNRLSDFLFVIARAVNHAAEIPEKPWMPRERHES
jgi:cob(I)alamin adenosyltransferase